MSTLKNVGLGEVTGSPPAEDWWLRRATNWRLSYCLWPRTCFLTGKKLWLKKCYKGVTIISGPGDPVNIDYYIEKSEFIIWNLKGKK